MFLYGLLMLTAAGCVVGLARWRWGPFLMIAVGLLQDPVRKLTPGAPAYLVLPAALVWGSTMLGALLAGDMRFGQFRKLYPGLGRAMSIFGILLIPPAIASLTYGAGAWQVTLLGLFSYGSLLLGILAGTNLPTHNRAITGVLLCYVVLCSPLVAGSLLEKFGVHHPVLGGAAMGHTWVTHRMGSAGVYMLSGAFRSPDVNGWHAATVTMCAIVLAVSCRRNILRIGYGALAALSSASLLLSSRRKMVAAVPAFLIVFVLLHFRHMRARYMVPLMGLVLLVLAAVGWGYARLDLDTETEAFLFSTAGDAEQRLVAHGWRAMVTTYHQAGFFGYGIGMASQGAHHLKSDRPRVWQEGGPGKLMAELGVPGTIGFLFVAAAVAQALWRDMRRVQAYPQIFSAYAGLTAIIAANASAGIVSAQIFGDPFIASLLALFLGMALSSARLRPVGEVRLEKLAVSDHTLESEEAEPQIEQINEDGGDVQGHSSI